MRESVFFVRFLERTEKIEVGVGVSEVEGLRLRLGFSGFDRGWGEVLG